MRRLRFDLLHAPRKLFDTKLEQNLTVCSNFVPKRHKISTNGLTCVDCLKNLEQTALEQKIGTKIGTNKHILSSLTGQLTQDN
jgi:hypothetical protein